MRAGSLPAWESALLTAAVASSPTSSLVQHLLDQQAARAAARLASTLGLGAATLECKRPLSSQFSVPATAVRLVADEASAIEFAEFVRRTVGLQSTVAIDVEWRPDAPSSPKHRPSLVQLAAAAPPATASEPWVWLIDLEQRDVVATSHALEGLRALLASDRTRVLGFGLQTDVDRLQMLFDSGAPAASAAAAATTATTATTATEVVPTETPAPLLVRRAVDLREACNASAAAAALPSKSASLASGSLASQVLKWTGWSLDKTSQCSDWQRRPLTTTQLAYAAADAACLLVLDTALAAAEVERPECCMRAVLSTLSTGPVAAAKAAKAAEEAKATGEAVVASAFEGKEEEEYAQAAPAVRQTAATEGDALRLEARTLPNLEARTIPNLEAQTLPNLEARTESDALCLEGLARTRAVVSLVTRAFGVGVDVAEVTQREKVTLWGTSVKAAVEINALCFTAGPAGPLLVLYPAGELMTSDCL